MTETSKRLGMSNSMNHYRSSVCNLSQEAIDVDNSMDALLDNCHTLFNDHNFTKNQMEAEKELMYGKVIVHTRSKLSSVKWKP